MTNHTRHHWKLIPAIVMMTLIFIHSSMNGDESTLESDTLIHILGIPLTDTVVIVVRKCAHIIEYIVLGASIYFVTEDWYQAKKDQNQNAATRNANSLHKSLWQAWFVAFLYAVTDEIHQCFVPGRSGEIADVIIDSIGCLIGVAIMYIVLRRRDA